MPNWKEIKEKYKLSGRNKCFVCLQKRNYTNPLEECFECKKRFCFDHIFAGQITSKMRGSELLRDICEKCKREKGYENS